MKVVEGIKSVKEFLEFSPQFDNDIIVDYSIKFSMWRNETKTIVCHDMKGGYLRDKYTDGYIMTEDDEGKDCFTFAAWNFIDMFIYFSHSFITLPPIGWINAAHNTDTAILGTFIVERHEVLEEICKNFDKIAHKLDEITKKFKLQGWLFNIECDGTQTDMMLFFQFLKLLKEIFGKYRKEEDRMIHLMWYDALLPNGVVSYQNMVNESNKIYLNYFDSIFLNYNWSPNSLGCSRASVNNYENRIYVGLDVFGRGMIGNGKFNTFKALQIVRRYSMSAALFAFGWVHECCDFKSMNESFHNNLYFWRTLLDFLKLKPVHKGKNISFNISWYQQEEQIVCFHLSKTLTFVEGKNNNFIFCRQPNTKYSLYTLRLYAEEVADIEVNVFYENENCQFKLTLEQSHEIPLVFTDKLEKLDKLSEIKCSELHRKTILFKQENPSQVIKKYSILLWSNDKFYIESIKII
ncbi:hypothetical protein SNEBB_005470 [Seison nebaliae]|nr:hypothetical protein SNEBB_005470 [Seison nebaliae]